LDLGPQWLANYVITVITEIMSASLELAIVQGTGKNQPIGMMKKLSGATDSVYPDKQKVSIDKLDAKNLGAIRGALAEAKTDTGNVVILVHPATYWSKVFPQLAFQTQMGTWVTDKLPTGEEIIKSYAVPKETLIFGDLKNYFLGVASNVKIERYKETLAIEDMDLFIAKFYGYGLAKDKNAFFVADITGIQGGTIPQLEVFAKNTGDNKDSTITNTTENLSV
jgi:phage capsid family